MFEQIRITTTSNVEGWTIETYHGIVSASVVAGTGFFSDFAAGFTDFFGGRSGAYHKQLAALQSEVLDQLQQKALRLGANWIVGTRMDFDEISGKGMQMFMVTAQGTAVRAREESLTTVHRTQAAIAVPATELQNTIHRRTLATQVSSGQLDLANNENWASITEHRIDAAVPHVLQYILKHQSYGAETTDAERRAIDFLQVLPAPALQERLHRAIAESPDLEELASRYIIDMNLIDLAWIERNFSATDFRLRRAALQLLRGDVHSYTASDIVHLDALLNQLKTAFPDRTQIIEKKGMFSKTPEPRWHCPCGTDNALSSIYCGRCQSDRRGIKDSDLSPEAAINLILARLEILREMLVPA